MKMKRSIMVTIGWLTAAGVFAAAMMILEINWNLFDWNPRLDLIALACGFGILGALAAIWLLARSIRDKSGQVISFVLCVLLVGLAIHLFPAEFASEAFLERKRPSPLWFRGARVLLMSLPSAFWLGEWFRWRRAQPNKTVQ
jgi:hypothetical protein